MLPLSQNQLQSKYNEAMKLMQQSKGEDALTLFKQLLETKPNAPEIHFQIGQLLMKALRFDPAVDAFKKAIKLAPKNTQIWRGYSEALLRAGTDDDINDALDFLKNTDLQTLQKKEIKNWINGNAVVPQPKLGSLPQQQLQKTVQMLQKGQAVQAIPFLQKLLKAHPKVGVLHGVYGTALRDSGQTAKAVQALKRSTRLDANIFDTQFNLGHLLLRSGETKVAITHLEMARTLNPKSPPTLLFLADAYEQIDMAINQRNALDKAIKADSKFTPALLARARLANKENNYVQALELLEKCIKLGGDSADVYLLKSNILSSAGDQQKAIESIKIAIAKDPKNASILGQLATLLQSSGDFEEAERTFKDAIALNPLLGTNYRVFSASHKFQSDDPLIAQMEQVYEDKALKPVDKMQLGFALSKAMEDTKQYDKAFPYLNASNSQMRKDHPYDIAARRDQVDRTKKIFANLISSGKIGSGSSDYAPIFVTGMPRSGTTLVEQILSSHSTVTGAGEMARFNREALNLLMSPKGDRIIESISAKEFNKLADHYQTYVKTLHPESVRISDKSIQTYLVMGLVWCTLPKAKIIVVRRDPRDNLLSVYKNVFPTGGHLYSYDMNDLGQYYRMFVEMIEFWREINPNGFHEIWYEDLISNPEEETRKLIAAAGLEWEDACLNFHENKRKVNTLSVYQVRQPIYKSSVKAWQRYEKELKPLFDSLGDLADHKR